MSRRASTIKGVILIVVGLLLLFRESIKLPILLGSALLLVGIWHLLKQIGSETPRLLGSFLAVLFGLYFIIGPFVLTPFNGHSHLAFGTLLLGMAFILAAIFAHFRPDYLILGIMFTLLGMLFVLRFLHVLFSEQLVTLVDTWWPLILVFGGLALVSRGWWQVEKTKGGQ